MIDQRIHQRTVPVAMRGMHYHARRFIEDQQVIVLEHDIERNIFGFDIRIAGRVRQRYGDYVRRFDFVTGFREVAIHPNRFCVDCGLNFSARGVLQPVHQEAVNPQQALAFIDHNTVMLV